MSTQIAVARGFQLSGGAFPLFLRGAAQARCGPRLFSTNPPTPVNVADIKLPKPKRKAKVPDFVQGLEERTKGSLIPETLKAMETDEEFQLTAKALREKGQARMTKEEAVRRRRALDRLGVPSFHEFLAAQSPPLAVPRAAPAVLQLNVGLHCNQACAHCHVESSPKRTEAMSQEVADRALALLRASPSLTTLDLTGGAPELHAVFRPLVKAATEAGVEVIDRCNLTVLTEPGQEDLAEFLAANKVRVVASLPCYSAKNVNLQRGSGVFDRSVAGLRKLNELGYGREGTGLHLDLVYNPLGAFLPPPQAALEEKYREELMEHFGIEFNGLFTISNMPIKRFADFLHRRGELEEYMGLLVRTFNPAAVQGLMCRNHLSVRWDGALFDCDFNQQLGMGMGSQDDGPYAPDREDFSGISIFDVESVDQLMRHPVVLASHCFGCTAGMGSSCQGTTA